MEIMWILPTVRYVAVGHYNGSAWYRYADATINNTPHVRERFGARIVLFLSIPQNGWERGARGEGDFWGPRERLKSEEVTRFCQQGGFRELVCMYLIISLRPLLWWPLIRGVSAPPMPTLAIDPFNKIVSLQESDSLCA